MSRPRVAFARISQETNALSPIRTTLDDFRRTHWFEGDALLSACEKGGYEAPGFLRNAELSGFVRGARDAAPEVELVPLFSAWAIPGGKLSAETLAAFEARLREDLERAGPLDGLMLSMHGAMTADGDSDPEGRLLQAARQALGEAKLAVSFDLHGQLTPAKVDSVDVLTAYQTNPHRDHFSAGRRAGRILLDTIPGRVRPTAAWRTLPMVLGGGTNLDFLQPMRPLFRQVRNLSRRKSVLDASLFTCHLWNDAPELGWSTHVITDGEPALAEDLAEELAEAAWQQRHYPPPELPDASTAIVQARQARLARMTGPVCISDLSDMVGAGAVGESTWLLKALLEEATDLTSYAPIRDDDLVARLWEAPEGTVYEGNVGGRLAPEVSPPLPVRGTLRRKVVCDGFGRMLVLDLGHVQLVVTEAPPLAMKPSFYSDVGLPPMKADICVVKSLFPFRLFFLPQNRKTIYARTFGMTDLDAWRRLPADEPFHPRDEMEDWRPTDRRRRLGR